MEPFEGLDFYDIESLLTEEEVMIATWCELGSTMRSSRRTKVHVETVSSSMNGVGTSVRWVSSVHR